MWCEKPKSGGVGSVRGGWGEKGTLLVKPLCEENWQFIVR